ncbi:2-keto-3-deoxygluconate permease (KDG permease) [Lachnospiraceae bacterium TWA4]|nr:2-keto-3-deoxygluconate permease (KDG permease) [Lachnospiraceae bacterium TWA4]
MKIPILKTLKKIPGGLMLVPLILGALVNSVCPQVLEIGGFTTALLKGGTNAFVAFFFVCSGSQIKLREAALPVAKGVVLLVSKFIIGAALGIFVSKVWGPAGVLGLTPLAIISAVTNSSGTLYVSLASEFGDSSDVAAIGPLCINDSPFLAMIVFGAAGLADIPLLSLVASIFPLILGMILGNIDDDIREFLAAGNTIIIPFVAFCLGANLKFQSFLMAGMSGVLLGAMTVILTGLGGYFAIALCNHGKPKAVGAAIGSSAGICAATPVYLAEIDPSLATYLDQSVAACTACTLLTAIFCPNICCFLV